MFLCWLATVAQVAAHGEPSKMEQSSPVEAAIARGVEYLLPRQYADGSWRMAGHEMYTGGTTAMACYALYKSGLPKEHAAIQLSLHFLESDEPVSIYDAALRVLLLTSIDPVGFSSRIQRAAKVLNYGPRQYFTYQADRGRDVTGDMSNHQYGLVGLEALDHYGFETDEEFWLRASEFLIRQADDDGGWGYYPNTDPNATMVLSGIASSACCLKVLQRHGWKPKLQKRLQKVLDLALVRAEKDWFLDQPMKRAPLNRWFFYACYGVERAMAILQQKKLGALDWYALIADEIVAKQRKNGSWSCGKGEPEMNTAFALLTLSRATASTGGVGEEQEIWQRQWTSAADGKVVQVTASGLPQCAVFLTGFDRAWFEEQTWEGELSPRLAKVEWWLNDELVSTVVRSEQQWRLDCSQPVPHRFSQRLTLPANGEYQLRARLSWLPPETWANPTAGTNRLEREIQPSDWEQLDSGVVVIHASGLLDEAVKSQMNHRARHVHPQRWTPKEVQVIASSAIGGESGASWALDRCHATAWRWKASDQERSWCAEWEKPVRANSIRIVAALPADQNPDGYAMPKRVKLKVNGRKAVFLDFSAEDWRSGCIFHFRKSEKMRKIELEVTSVHSHRGNGVGGISEIEFFDK